MKTIVIYASRHGNTQRVAEAIADGIRAYCAVEVLPIDTASAAVGDADLVVIGGPTEAHGMTPPVKEFFDSPGAGALKGVRAAAFDTRLDWPRWLSGSAGTGMLDRLHQLGADVVSPQASFLVEGKEPVLKPGELERAEAWGNALARTLRSEVTAVR